MYSPWIQINPGMANLHGAFLWHVDFRNAQLGKVYMQEASLGESDFRGAYLERANLTNAKFINDAIFDETTVLPDGTNWSPDSDLTRFTDPEHPDHWDAYWKDNQAEEALF